jgi:hypothetical protein
MVAPMAAAKLLKMARPLLKKGFESAKPLLKKGFESAKPLAKRAFTSSKKAYAEYSPAIQKNISTGYSKATEYIKNQRLQNKQNRLGKLQNVTTTPTQASNFESSSSSTKPADNTVNVAQNNNTQQNLLNALQQSTALIQQTISQIASMGPNPTSNSPTGASSGGIDTGAPQPPTQYGASSNNTNSSINNQQKSKKSLPQRLGSLSGKASVKLSEMKTDFKESYKQKRLNGGAEGTTTPSARPTKFTQSSAQMSKAFKDLANTGKQVFNKLNTLNAQGGSPNTPTKQAAASQK